jgi:AAHS family cis,cis-muconate transporter-like MFS transporter
MGAAYFIAGVIPGLFIRERQYDPQQSSLVTATDIEAKTPSSVATTNKTITAK